MNTSGLLKVGGFCQYPIRVFVATVALADVLLDAVQDGQDDAATVSRS